MKQKKVKISQSQSDDLEKFYKSEAEKYKKYLKATQITNLNDIAQELSKDPSNIKILTDY